MGRGGYSIRTKLAVNNKSHKNYRLTYLKILFRFVGDSVGGSHLSSIGLYKVLVDQGYDVRILLHKKEGPLSRLLKERNIKYYVLKSCFLAGDSPKISMIIFVVLKNILPLIIFIKKH